MVTDKKNYEVEIVEKLMISNDSFRKIVVDRTRKTEMVFADDILYLSPGEKLVLVNEKTKEEAWVGVIEIDMADKYEYIMSNVEDKIEIPLSVSNVLENIEGGHFYLYHFDVE